MKNFKRFLAVTLALCMILSSQAIGTLAAEIPQSESKATEAEISRGDSTLTEAGVPRDESTATEALLGVEQVLSVADPAEAPEDVVASLPIEETKIEEEGTGAEEAPAVSDAETGQNEVVELTPWELPDAEEMADAEAVTSETEVPSLSEEAAPEATVPNTVDEEAAPEATVPNTVDEETALEAADAEVVSEAVAEEPSASTAVAVEAVVPEAGDAEAATPEAAASEAALPAGELLEEVPEEEALVGDDIVDQKTEVDVNFRQDGNKTKLATALSGETQNASITLTHSDPIDNEPAYVQIKIDKDKYSELVTTFAENDWSDIQIEDPLSGAVQVIRVFYNTDNNTITYEVPHGATVVVDLAFKTENGVTPDGTSVKLTPTIVESDLVTPSIKANDKVGEPAECVWEADFDWDPVDKKVNGADTNEIAVNTDNKFSDTLYYTFTQNSLNNDATGAIWTDYVTVIDNLVLPSEFKFDVANFSINLAEGAIYSGEKKVFSINLNGAYTIDSLSYDDQTITFKATIKNEGKATGEIDNIFFDVSLDTSAIILPDGYASRESFNEEILNTVDTKAIPVVPATECTSSDTVTTTTSGYDGSKITKSSSKDKANVTANEVIDYTIVVSNEGEGLLPAEDDDGVPYKVVDQLPAGVYLTDDQLIVLKETWGDNVDYDVASNQVVFTPGAIPSGQSITYSFNATVRDAEALANLQIKDKNVLTNTVSYRGKSSAVFSVLRVGKVTVDKTGNKSEVKDGETAHFEITAKNATAYDALLTESQNIMTDTLPAYLVLQNVYLDANEDGTPDSSQQIDFTDAAYHDKTLKVVIKNGSSYWKANVYVDWNGNQTITAKVTEDGKLAANTSVTRGYDVKFDKSKITWLDDKGCVVHNNVVALGNGERDEKEIKGVIGKVTVDKEKVSAVDAQGQTVDVTGVLTDQSVVTYSIKVYNDPDNPYTDDIVVTDTMNPGLFPKGLVDSDNNKIEDITSLSAAITAGKSFKLDGTDVKVELNNNVITLIWTVANSANNLVGTDPNNPYVITYESIVVTDNIGGNIAGEKEIINNVKVNWSGDSEKIKVRKDGVGYDKVAVVDGVEQDSVTVRPNETITYKLTVTNDTDKALQAEHVRDQLPQWKADADKGVVASSDWWSLDTGTVVVVDGGTSDFVHHFYDSSKNCYIQDGTTLCFSDYSGLLVPAKTTLVQEVQLTFPSNVSMEWTNYYNEFSVNYNPPEKVRHDPDPDEAYSLQKSVAALSKDAGSGNLSAYATKDEFSADETDYVTYAVTFVNTGEGAITLKTLEDELPAGLTYVGIAEDTSAGAIGTKVFTKSEIYPTDAPGAVVAPDGYSWMKNDWNPTIKLTASASGQTVTIAVNDGAGFKVPEKKGICFFIQAKIDDKAAVKASEELTNYVRATTDGDAVWNPISPKLTQTPDDSVENYGESYELGTTASGDKEAESKVTIHPTVEIIPGILKEATNYSSDMVSWSQITDSTNIDSQKYIKWKITLYNDGTEDITNYSIVDDLHHFEKFVKVDSFVIYGPSKEPITGNLSSDPEFAFTAAETGTTDNHSDKQHTFVLKNTGTHNYTIPIGGYAEMEIITYFIDGQLQGLIDNKATFKPEKEFNANKVRRGQLEKEVVDDSEKYTGVSSSDYVNALGSGGTVSSKTIQEKDNPENMGWGNRGNENKHFIYVDSVEDIVTYVNHVQNASDSLINSMVMIDRLPEIGDVGVVNRTARDSEFSVSVASPMNLSIVIVNDAGSIQIPLTEGEDFTIEYANLQGYTKEDFAGNPLSHWTSDPTGANSFRIILNQEPVNNKIRAADTTVTSKECILPQLWSMDVTYDGKISEDARPGEFAWNSFGYHYTTQDGYDLTAEPPKVGVGIPPQPVLKKIVVDSEDNDQGEGTDQFEFMAYEVELNEDGTEKSRTAVWDSWVSIEQGGSYDLLAKKTVNGVERGWFEDGKTYVIEEKSTAGYKPTYWTVDGLKRAAGENEVQFTYEAIADIVVVCRNVPIQGSIEVSKIVQKNGSTDTTVDTTVQVGLFKLSGETYTQVGDAKTITVEDGVTTTKAAFTDLDLGTYYVFELNADGSRAVGTYGRYKVTGSGTSVEITDESTKNVTITNNLEEGEITVNKTVKYNGATDTEADDLKFTVGLFTKDGDSYKPVGTTKEISVADGVGSVKFEHLELGTYYVFEMNGTERVGNVLDAYAVTGSGSEVILANGGDSKSASIINEKTEKGKITVNKTVKYNGEVDTENAEAFNVAIFTKSGETYTQVGETKTINTVKGVGSVEFPDLALGTYYVFEMDGTDRVGDVLDAYAVTGSGTEAVLARGDLEKTVAIVNAKTEKGKITVNKTVKYNGAVDEENAEAFDVAIFTKEGETYTQVGETKTINTVKGVGSVEFPDLVLGTYYVFEMDGTDRVGDVLDAYAVTGSGTEAVLARGDLEKTVAIVNAKTEKGKITVNKTVKYNGAVDEENAEAFDVAIFTKEGETYTQVGETKTINTANGVGSVEFPDLALGTYYVFEMDGTDRVGDVLDAYAVTGSGTEAVLARGNLEKTVAIVNEKTEKGKITVSKKVMYNGAVDEENAEAFDVAIFTKEGETYTQVGETKTINTVKGVGSVEFPNLTLGTYYVFEMDGTTRVEGTYKEYAVTGSGTVAAPARGEIEKTVEIINAKSEKGQIVVTKNVLYNGAADTEADGIEFKAALFKKDGETYTQVGETKTISVTDGTGSATFDELDFGTYYVFEMDGTTRVEGTYNEYTVTGSGTSATLTRTVKNGAVTITNAKTEKGKITVSKKVMYNGAVDEENAEAFDVAIFTKEGETYTQVGETKTINTVKGVGSVEFPNLTLGTYYVFEMDGTTRVEGTYKEYAVTGSGTVAAPARGELEKTVEIINAKSEKGQIVVTKNVLYNGVTDTEADGIEFKAALFKKDGETYTQVGETKTISVTDGTGSATFDELDFGTYYVFEMDGTTRVEGTYNEYTVTSSGTSATLTRTVKNGAVTIINEKTEKGKITVTKTVKYNGEVDTENAEAFDVAIFTKSGETYTQVGETKTINTAKGVGSVEFPDLALGTYYVFEMDGTNRVGDVLDAYAVTGSGSTAVLARGDLEKTVAIVNEKTEKGKITVSKKVMYNGAVDEENAEAFDVAIFTKEGEIYTQIGETKTINTVKGVGSVEFPDLALGTYYVFEMDGTTRVEGTYKEYAVTGSGTVAAPARGDLTKTVEIINAKSEKGQIVVTKNVLYNGTADTEADDLKFTVGLFTKDGDSYTPVGSTQEITVTDGVGSTTFNNLDFGTYYVFEMDGEKRVEGSYLEYAVTGSGTSATLTRTVKNGAVTIINEKTEKGKITVTKTVKYNGEVDTENAEAFNVAIFTKEGETYTQVGETKTINTAKGVGSVEFPDLALGIYYVFEMDGTDRVGDVLDAYAVTGSGTEAVLARGNLAKTVAIVNEKTEKGKITVTKTVKYNGEVDEENAEAFNVAIFTKDGETYTQVGETKTINTAKGVGSVEFPDLALETYYVFEMDGTDRVGDAIDAYAVTGSGTEAVLARGDLAKTVAIVNEKTEKGKITVTKTVKYNGEVDEENAEAFDVAIFTKSGETYTQAGETKTINTVKGVGSVEFPNLALGTYYVFEMDGTDRVGEVLDAYAVTGSGTEAVLARGDLAKTVAIVNEKTEKGKITVNKTVKYNGVTDIEADAEEFDVAIFTKEGETYTQVGEKKTIQVTDGEGSVTFENVDFGTYYVFEIDASGNRAGAAYGEYVVTGSGTEAVLTRRQKSQTVEIVNAKTETGKIEVTKSVYYNGAIDTINSDTFTVGLFTKSGETYTQVGDTKTFEMDKGTGKATFDNLALGTYYVFEMNGTERVTNKYGKYTVTGSGTEVGVTRANLIGKAEIINSQSEKGEIVVSKRLLYNGELDTSGETTEIKVGLFTKDGETFTMTHEGTISLTGGTGSCVFSNLEFSTYYVYELDADGNRVGTSFGTWVVSGSGTSVPITRDSKSGQVTITNEQVEKGKLTVNKTVKYNGVLDTTNGDSFSVAIFTKTGEDLTQVGAAKAIAVTAGVGSVTFDDLELGTYYVYELDDDGNRVGSALEGYTVTGSGSQATLERGALTATLDIVNDKIETGKITVTKTVKYNGEVDTESADSFTVGLFTKAADGSYTVVGSTKEITVNKGTGEAVFDNLALGTYYVFEMSGSERVDDALGEYVVTGSGTDMTPARGELEQTAEIINEKTEKGQITVNKTVKYNGETDTEADAEAFDVAIFKKEGETYTQVGEKKIIQVTDGVGSVTFANVDFGTYYVFELAVDGSRAETAYGEYAVTGSGTTANLARTGKTATVDIVNEKTEKGQITVNKTVKYAGAVNTESSESFKVGLFKKNGELMEQVGTTKTIAVTAGVGSATFGDLDFGTYYVYELDANGDRVDDALGKYEVTGSGTEAVLGRAAKTATVDIVNSEKAPAVVKFSGQKTLNGKVLEDGMFTFELREGTDASADPIQTVKNKSGRFEFAELTFDAVGEYPYMITEHIPVAGDADYINGVTYDSTVYNVTVTVVAEANAYKATISGLKTDGSGADFDFENNYSPSSTFAVFEGTKTFENYPEDKTPPTFEFTLSENGEVIDTVSTVGSGSFKFKSIEYKKTGSHTYTVVEKKISAGGVTCDETEYTVKVAVTDVGGELKATVSDNATKLNFKNTYEAKPVTMDFDAHKTLNGQTEKTTLKAGDFTFALKDAAGVILQSKPNDGEGNVTFAPITYTKAGIYTYTITETVPDKKAGGITYSEEVYTVTVEVTDDGTGQLAAEKTVKNSAGSVVTVAEFTNVYDASGSAILKGEKTLTGREFKAGDKFTFTVTADAGVPLPDPAAVTIEPTSGDTAAFEFAAIEYGLADVGKTYKYTVTESGSGPGITNDTGKHTVEVKITDNGDGTLAAVPTYSDGEKLAYTNTYDAKGSVVLKGAKTLTGREFKAGDKFTFTVTADAGAPLPDPASVTIEPTSGYAAEYEFAAIEYGLADVDKTYEYTVTETGSGEGVTNDTGTHTATVKVTDNYDGTLKVEETYSDGTSLAFINTYKAVGQAEILAKKNFTGRAWKDGDAFTFKLEAVTEGAPLPETTEITVTNDVAKGFGNMKFEAVGEYEYKVTEVIPEDAKKIPGVTYATEPQTVKVTATDPNHDGKLSLEVKYADAEKKYAEFTNTYKPGPTEQVIKAKKILEGGTLKADEFSFVLMDADGKELQLKKNDAEGNVVFDPIKYTAEDMADATEKSFTYTITEVNSNEAGIIYDLTVHKAVVTVKDDPKTGMLVASVKYDEAAEADATDAAADTAEDSSVEDTAEDASAADATTTDASDSAAANGSAADTEEADATEAENTETAEAVPEFVNKVIEFHFNKVDADDASEVAGAVLVLYEVDEEGKETEVDRWTSVAGADHDFGPVLKCDATYILRETLAPRGYGRVTKDISISIAEDGTVDTALIKSTDKNGNTVYLLKDDAIQFQITKVVLGTVRGLSGATIALVEVGADGKLVKNTNGALSVLHSWVSVAGQVHDFGPYMESGKKYMLVETTAPSGYTPIAGVAVTVEDDGTVKVTLRSLKDRNGDPIYLVENSKKPTSTPTPTPKRTKTPTPTPRTRITATPTPTRNRTTGAKTGDDSPIEGYFLLLVAAIAVVAVTKRRSKA